MYSSASFFHLSRPRSSKYFSMMPLWPGPFFDDAIDGSVVVILFIVSLVPQNM